MAKRTSFTVTIDPNLLKAEMSMGKNGNIVAEQIHRVITDDIQKAQNTLVKNLLTHPVSREIESGPRASNSSGTLGGYGNLFSFLGFGSGDNPVSVIQNIFSKKMKYTVRPRSGGRFLITVQTPKAEEIFEATPMPWASGLSWAEGIEQGVSNAAAYLFNPRGFSNSTSGTGLQSQNNVSGVSFKRTPYISQLIKEFKQDLLKI